MCIGSLTLRGPVSQDLDFRYAAEDALWPDNNDDSVGPFHLTGFSVSLLCEVGFVGIVLCACSTGNR